MLRFLAKIYFAIDILVNIASPKNTNYFLTPRILVHRFPISKLVKILFKGLFNGENSCR